MVDKVSENKIEKIRAKLEEENADAFIVAKDANMRYLYFQELSISPSTYIIVPRRGEVVAIVSSLERVRSSELLDVNADIEQKVFSPYPWIERYAENGKSALRKTINEMGFGDRDKSIMTDSRIGLRVRTSSYIEELREIKSDVEMEDIKRACKIVKKCPVEELVEIGRTELDVKHDIDNYLSKNDSKPSFETIVATGRHSAYSHHESTDKRIEKGDAVICDFGAIYKGYCSDITRTFIFGNEKLEEIYRLVEEGQKIAIQAFRDKREYREIDMECRRYFHKREMAGNFPHSLGHGIGLEVHEAPYLSSKSKNKIRDRNVFTIEPGIYIKGLGGIRIEDDFYIKNGRIECLTR